jgi:hypothetical protein
LSFATFQVSEEVAVWIENQEVAFVFEHLAIGIDAAIKAIKLWVLIEGSGVNLCRLGIPIASQ